ncbi:NAD(P)H-binding protein [Streptomyces sp. WAC05374]|uniref:NAD(P)H-binding protein n=1 Tax=Streptomyces sp. WAC05374 TaxID=2487420 RepID=UPI001F1779CD|nr:NAD(P)H-binding protein [Streptomyces sp. WAC05374]
MIRGDGDTRPVVALTGATGTIGRLVAHGLAAGGDADGDGAAVDVRLLVRDPDKARRAGLPGRAVRADFGHVDRLTAALDGADSLFVVTTDPARPDHDENVLAAARTAGVRRVVKLSALAVLDPGAQDVLTRWQRDNEERLRASGLAWTLLRPRAFMSNALGWAASVREEGVVRGLYGSGRNACVDPRDVADAAVRALLDPAATGRSYALTGPEPLSAREQTETLGAVLGRPLTFVELTEEQALERWRARWPEPMVRALLEGARRQRDGAKEAVADGVREATGHAPRGFVDWARAHAEVFEGPSHRPASGVE